VDAGSIPAASTNLPLYFNNIYVFRQVPPSARASAIGLPHTWKISRALADGPFARSLGRL